MVAHTIRDAEAIRDLADRSVDQAREAFEGFVRIAQVETTDEGSVARKAVGARVMGFAGVNIRAAFDHAQRLFRAADMAEITSLQAQFLRDQMAVLSMQASELAVSAQPTSPGSTVGAPLPVAGAPEADLTDEEWAQAKELAMRSLSAGLYTPAMQADYIRAAIATLSAE